MNSIYCIDLKRKLCTEVCLNGKSTIKIAHEYHIPLKTLEKWITAFYKDPHCFDSTESSSFDYKPISPVTNEDYDDLSLEDLKKEIMKKDIEIARLKKSYTVKEGGMEEKVFITFSKENMK